MLATLYILFFWGLAVLLMFHFSPVLAVEPQKALNEFKTTRHKRLASIFCLLIVGFSFVSDLKLQIVFLIGLAMIYVVLARHHYE